jgi:hypothetical protein
MPGGKALTLFTASTCCGPLFDKSPNTKTSVSDPKDCSAAFCTSSGTAGVAGTADAEGEPGAEPGSGLGAGGELLPQPAVIIDIATIVVIREILFMNANSIASSPVTEALCVARYRDARICSLFPIKFTANCHAFFSQPD